jgi:hypothetical protein
MDFSPILLVRQHFPDRSLRDIPGEVGRQLHTAGFSEKLRPGARVAIGVGSRGISNIATIVKAAVDFWKARGAQPFLFPAMGSHGAATAEGQADVLAHYGIHEATMGCPVISALDVVSLGSTADGIGAFMDRNAYEADAVMLVARVKWHTDFAGKLESGLFKMMAIGLGKFAGAKRYHTYAYRMGLERVIRTVGRQVLGSGRVIGGLAILEDAHHNTARIAAVPANSMEQQEEALLETVKGWMPRIPFALDVLMIDQIGKNISGAGMDTKVVNRGVQGEKNLWDTAPPIERIFLRDLSELSYGNAVGFGMADVVHDRLLNKIDWTPTEINCLTSGTPSCIKTPLHYASDRTCLEKISGTVGRLNASDVRIGWIQNTMELAEFAATENLRGQIEADRNLEIAGEARELAFNSDGNLQTLNELLAESAGREDRIPVSGSAIGKN